MLLLRLFKFLFQAFIVVHCLFSVARAQFAEEFEPTKLMDLPAGKVTLTWNPVEFRKLDTGISKLPLAGFTTTIEKGSHEKDLWQRHGNEMIWRLQLEAKDVSEVTLYFSHFEAGAEGKLFILNADGDLIRGAFTRRSTRAGQPFSIGPLPGGALILQFETSADASDYSFSLSEGGLLRSDESSLGFGTSGDCEVNINCSEGAAWQRQKRGVARIVVKQGGALYYCSGSLINNTRKDSTPYFLTANHCGEYASAADYAQWIFAFNFEAPECNRPPAEPLAQSLTGADLIAKAPAGTQNANDFKLLRLFQNVPVTYNPYFNGWSRQNVSSTSGVGIHHPDGDVKKISTYTTPTTSSNYGFGGSNPDAYYWRLSWSETENGHGVTEGGSSGSPLFDSNGRIIGALTGGSSSCNDLESPDFYGKFSASWDAQGGDPTNQLAPWLDPDNTDLMVLGGLGSDTLFVESDFESMRTELSVNQFAEFENLSVGKITSWEWKFDGGKPSVSTAKDPGPILYENYGSFDVTLIVQNQTSSDTLRRIGYINILPFLFPNPSKGQFELAFGVDITPEAEIFITDALGRPVNFRAATNGQRISVSLVNPRKGLYLVKVKDARVEKILKMAVVL